MTGTAIQSAAEIERWLGARVAALTGAAADAVASARSFAELGLGSRHAISLAGELGAWLGREVSPTLLYEHPSPSALARHLGGEDRPAPARLARTAGAAAEEAADGPVAIVGIGCRFPGAHGPGEFWDRLRLGVDALGGSEGADRRHLGAGGFLADVERFDAAFFGITPREAERMDPQQRLLLETAWEALEDAAVAADELAGRAVGVFVGASTGDYGRLQLAAGVPADPYVATGSAASLLANRLSYLLDLRGPSLTLDTACSSSLVAVYEACASLERGDCELALAGGVNVILAPDVTRHFEAAGLLAPDGRCKAYDERGDGYVRGEGVGVVVLKPLAAARRDGDPVYAVVRGGAVNHDGRTNGLMAPSGGAQESLLAAAYRRAGVAPGEVAYVEGHGSGTALGDAIEARALGNVLGRGRAPGGRCALGSVKSNLGHLEAAAGIAGLIKTALALDRGQIPPSLHYRRPGPDIPFDELPLAVQADLGPWPGERMPPLAGVSSFGFGGANAHLVLEGRGGENSGEAAAEAPAEEAAPAPWRLLPVSAASEEAADEACRRLAAALEERPGVRLEDVARTLFDGRARLRHRRAVIARDAASAAAALASGDPRRSVRGVAGARPRPVVFAFSGIGDQYPGMAARLYAAEPVFRAHLDRCLDLLEPHLDHELRPALLPPEGEAAGSGDGARDGGGGPDLRRMLGRGGGPSAAERRLQRTDLAHPAVFAVGYALARLWLHRGVEPAAMIGFSVGEYTAACLAGVLSLDDAAALVARRARLIEERAPAGAMLAVPLGEEALRPHLGGELSLAAVLAPERSVVAGPPPAVQALEQELTAGGLVCRPLAVERAFHSPALRPLHGAFVDLAASFPASPPQVPLLSNLTGTWFPVDQAPGPDYWADHMCRTVRFADGIETLRRGSEAPIVLEVGPGQTLSTVLRQYPPDGGGEMTALASLPYGYEREPDDAFALRTLAALWAAGAAVDLDRAAPAAGRRLRLPTYPFQRRRFWILDGASAQAAEPVSTAETVEPALAASAAAPAPTPSTATPGRAAQTARRGEELRSELRALFERLTGIAAAELDPRTPFLELGADSIVLVQAIRAIEERFGLHLSVRQFFEHLRTLDDLVAHLERELPAAPAETPVPPPAAPPSAAGLPVAAGSPALAPAMTAPASVDGSAPPSADGWREVIDRQLEAYSKGFAELAARQLEALGADATADAGTRDRPAAPAVPARASASATAPGARRPPPRPVIPFTPATGPEAGPAAGAEAARQKAHLEALTRRFTERTAGSRERVRRARRRLADSRAVVGFRPSIKEMLYPLVRARAEGAHLWDVDGNRYVDLTMGFGVHLFGHRPPFLQRALEEQLESGIELGPRSELAGEVAERLCAITGMDRAAFFNTGTEAVMTAVRLARAATGRTRVALFEGSYHGHSDVTLGRRSLADDGSAEPLAPGVPPGTSAELLVLDYGAEESLEILRRHRDELAAVLVEPVQSRRPDLQPREFLHRLRALTREAGAALVFDEMITGFRIHPAGAQGWYGVEADLATYGKIVGGGLPIGVVAGRAGWMDGVDGGLWDYGDDSYPGADTTFVGGTFCQHPLAMAGALAVLRELERRGPGLQEELNRRTAELAAALDRAFERAAAPIRTAHCGSLFRFDFAGNRDLLFYHLLEQGVYVWEWRNCFLSTAHADADCERVVEAVERSLAALGEGGFLPAAGERPARPAAADPVAAPAPFPTTDEQRELWALAGADAEAGCSFHNALALRLSGRVDEAALGAALAGCCERHEILGTAFSADGAALRPVPDRRPRLARIDLSALAGGGERIPGLLADLAATPFDLGAAPALRAALIRVAADDRALALVSHQAVADGWSLGVVAEETLEAYRALARGERPSFEPATPYREFAARRRSGGRPEAEDYWRRRFAEPPPALELPTDRPRPPVPSYRGFVVHQTLEGELPESLRRLAAAEGATLSMLLLAAFQALLMRLAGADELVVVVPVEGQPEAGSPRLVGDCLDLLPVRTAAPGDPTFRRHLAAVRGDLLDALEHRDYPFFRLIGEAGGGLDAGRWPLFNLDRRVDLPELPDGELEYLPYPRRHVNLDLAVNALPVGGRLMIGWEARSALWRPASVRRWAGHFETLLRAVVEDPDARLSRLAPAAAAEAEEMAVAPGSTVRAGGAGRPVPGGADGEEAAPPPGEPRADGDAGSAVAALAGELLGRGPLAPGESFFALGGHSLLALRLASRLRRALGVEVPVAAVLRSSSIAVLTARVEELLGRPGAAEAPPLVRAGGGEAAPLSYPQRRLWILDRLEPGPLYNIAAAVHLAGALEVAALAAALAAIEARHEVLRTTFEPRGEEPVQVVGPPRPRPLPVVDLAACPPARREAEAGRLAVAEARRPFDLEAGPLHRELLLRLGAGRHRLICTLHHVVADGWSLAVLLGELAAFYRAGVSGAASPLPALPLHYSDYARWQRGWLRGAALAERLERWRRRLTGAPPVLELPTDRPRPRRQSFNGAALDFELPAATVAGLRELGVTEGASLFMALLAAFGAVLQRWSGVTDLVVGTDSAGRDRVELEPLIGFFVNLLPLRLDLAGDPTFRALLGRVREVALDAFAHADLPFDLLAAELGRRSAAANPLVQVLFVLHNVPTPEVEIPGLEVAAEELENGTSKFDLALFVEENPVGDTRGGDTRGGGAQGLCRYNRDLFDAATIRRLLDRYRALLDGVVADPERPVSALELRSADERRRLRDRRARRLSARRRRPGTAPPEPPEPARVAAAAGADGAEPGEAAGGEGSDVR